MSTGNFINSFIIDGVQHPWTPGSWNITQNDSVKKESAKTLDLGRITSIMKVPDTQSYEYANYRYSQPQIIEATWDQNSFMDLCMRDQLTTLYELQRPFWIQFDEEMSRYLVRLECPDSNYRAYYTPTYPVYPLGWNPSNQIDWTDCLVVNGSFVNTGFVVHRPTGLVLFDSAQNSDHPIGLGYTWRAYVRIRSIEIRPLELARHLYTATVVFEQVPKLEYSEDRWNIILPCDPCREEMLGFENIDDGGGSGTGDDDTCYCEAFPTTTQSITEVTQTCDYIEVNAVEHVTITDNYYVTGIKVSTFTGDMDSQCQDDETPVIATVKLQAEDTVEGWLTWSPTKQKLNQPTTGGYETFGGPNDLWDFPFGYFDASTLLFTAVRHFKVNAILEDPTESCGAQLSENWDIVPTYSGTVSGEANFGGTPGVNTSYNIAWSSNVNTRRANTGYFHTLAGGNCLAESSGLITYNFVWTGPNQPPKNVLVSLTSTATSKITELLSYNALDTYTSSGANGLGDSFDYVDDYWYESTGTHNYTLNVNGSGIATYSFTPSASMYQSSTTAISMSVDAIITDSGVIAPCDREPVITDIELTIYASPACTETERYTDTYVSAEDDGNSVIELSGHEFSLPATAYVVGMEVSFEGKINNMAVSEPTAVYIGYGLELGIFSAEANNVLIDSTAWESFTVGGPDDSCGFSYVHADHSGNIPLVRGVDINGMIIRFEKPYHSGESFEIRNLSFKVYYVNQCGSEILTTILRHTGTYTVGNVGNGDCTGTIIINSEPMIIPGGGGFPEPAPDYDVYVPCEELLD